MDVPLALNNIGIRHGLKGYTRKSSTFSLQTDVVGLSVCHILFFDVGEGYNLQEIYINKEKIILSDKLC